ncbi:hypothetical protein LCGC14_0956340 [marine sediment metagenome]|uniref:Uncharacterized protein n=1 Tax=marine sediment metagenome TaxID=412755 RepID=A0A0F9RM88_9ZZZZ
MLILVEAMAAIQVGPDAIKQAALRRDVPVDKGLEFGTEKQKGNISNLVPDESLVDQRETVGF